VNTDARNRLAAQAAAAGYPPDLLALIVHATLPGYRPGERLVDQQIEQVADAMQVLAQAGYRAGTLADHIADYRRRHREEWRRRFWERALRIACIRYSRPDTNGISPCDTGADRFAQHAGSQAAPASTARAT